MPLPPELILKVIEHMDIREFLYFINIIPIYDVNLYIERNKCKIYIDIYSNENLDTLYEMLPHLYIDWYYISICFNLTTDLVMQFTGNLKWKIISQRPDLSDRFIDVYERFLNWRYLSKFQHLSDRIRTKYHNKISWKWQRGYDI
jgi:hypothetical protein